MAWETNILILPGNYSVAEIENNIEKFGDYGTSSVQYFSDKFFENESSAVKFLESLENEEHDFNEKFSSDDQKIFDKVVKERFRNTAVAVKFLSFSKEKGETIRKKICELAKKHIKSQIEYIESNFAKLKEKDWIECPHCESNLSTKYITSENCPLCENSLFDKEVHDAISSFDKEISEIASILLERDEKVKTHWCVIFNYHY